MKVAHLPAPCRAAMRIALKFALAAGLLLSHSAARADGSAVFTIHSQVAAPDPPRFGFNYSPSAQGGDKIDNTWMNAGQFTGYDSRMSYKADQDGTATTFVDVGDSGGIDFWASVQTGRWDGAKADTYRFENGRWRLLRTDTVAHFVAVTGSSRPADKCIIYADPGPPTKKGDVVWVYQDAQIKFSTNGVNARLVDKDNVNNVKNDDWFASDHGAFLSRTADAPPGDNWFLPDDPRGASLQIDSPTQGDTGIFQYLQAQFFPGCEHLDQGHTYEYSVWLRQRGVSDATVRLRVDPLGIAHEFTGVTDQWQHFTWQFQPTEAQCEGMPPNVPAPTFHLSFNGPATVQVNSLAMFDTERPPYTIDPRVVQIMKDFHPGSVRLWGAFAVNSGGYGFWSFDSDLAPENKTREYVPVDGGGRTYGEEDHLPASLALCKAVGTNPWILCNMSWSEEEWDHFADYLAGPDTTRYGAIRADLGHPAPWTDDFSKIYIEFGNEEWGTQHTAVNDHYGEYAHLMLSHFCHNPYIAPLVKQGKFAFIVNGFTEISDFGSQAAKACPEASYVDLFGYMGGGYNQADPDASFRSDLLTVPEGITLKLNQQEQRQAQDAAQGVRYRYAVYEGGPGSDDPNSKGQGDVSLAAGIGTLDEFLDNSLHGFGPQNFFLFNLGTGLYTSHTIYSSGLRAYPVWEALQLRNQTCDGDMMAVDASAPKTTNGSPLVSAYCFHNTAGGISHADIVVINRALDTPEPVTLHLPVATQGSAQLAFLTGNPRDNNKDSMKIVVQRKTVDNFSRDYSFTLPPGSAYFFQARTHVWPPAGPTGLNAAAFPGQVRVWWTPTKGAASYTVLRQDSPTDTPRPIASGLAGPHYVDATVQNSHAYSYTVTARIGGRVTDFASYVSAKPLAVGTPIYQIACAGSAIPGTGWVADEFFNSGGTDSGANGHHIDLSHAAHPAPEQVYQNNRYGDVTYTLPNLVPGGAYTVRLHFSEEFDSRPNQRQFNALLNGKQVLTNYDPIGTAGARYAASEQEFSVQADLQGNIILQMKTGARDIPIISGIEVLVAARPGDTPAAKKP